MHATMPFVPTPDQRPQLIHQAETLLHTDFFYDEHRSTALYDNFEALEGEELGARTELYVSTLRILAGERAEARPDFTGEDRRARIKEWNKGWRKELTPLRLGNLAVKYADQLYPLGRRLAILNHIERVFEAGLAIEGLYDHQIPYLEGVVAGLQRASERVALPEDWEGTEIYYKHGITVTGPTGIGKTAVMARLARALGVGRPAEVRDPENNPPVRMTGVVPSQQAIARLLGQGGEDLFRSLCPGVDLGGFYAHERRPEAHAVFSSVKLFKQSFRQGRLAGWPVDVLFVDEDHSLTQPGFLKTFLEEWDGMTIGFSATPAYNKGKDVRHILRHEVKVKTVAEYVGNVLSDLEIYLMVVHPSDVGFGKDTKTMGAKELRLLRQRAVSEKTRDFLLPLIAEGRKGMVFCEPGQSSDHAQTLAALLNGLPLPNGKKVRAAALGGFQGGSNSKNNRRLLREFEADEIDVITTTSMGQESIHLKEVNFVVAACKIASALKAYQVGGRGLVKSERFDTCVLANINTIGFGQNSYSNKVFAEVYTGQTIIRQGLVVSRQETGRKGKAKVGSPPAVTTKASEASKRRVAFPIQIQKLLDRIDHKTLAVAYLGPRGHEVTISPGYVPIQRIARAAGMHPRSAWQHLYRAGYRREIRTEVVSGRAIPVTYFEPAAETYFTQNPKPPEDGLGLVELRKFAKKSDIVTLTDLERTLHMGRQHLMNSYLTEQEMQAGERMRVPGISGRKPLAWPKEEGAKIQDRLRKLLLCPPNLVLASAVAANLDAKFKTVMEQIRRTRQELGVHDLQRGKLIVPGLPWASAALLVQRYGFKPGKELEFDLDRLPGADEDDPAKVAYARELQHKLGMSAQWLPPRDEEPTKKE